MISDNETIYHLKIKMVFEGEVQFFLQVHDGPPYHEIRL